MRVLHELAHKPGLWYLLQLPDMIQVSYRVPVSDMIQVPVSYRRTLTVLLLMSFWDITEISLTHLVFSKLVVQAMSHTTSQLDYLLSLLGLLKDMLSICKVWMYDLWIYCSILLNIWIQILCNFKIANTDITIMNVIWYTVKLFFNPLLS